MKRWAHWAVRVVELRIYYTAALLNMPFIRCTEKLPYVTQLAAIIHCYVDLCDEESTTQSLNYVALLHRFYWDDLLTMLEY